MFYENFLKSQNTSFIQYFINTQSGDNNTRASLKEKLAKFIGDESGTITTKSVTFKFYDLAGTLGRGNKMEDLVGKSIDEAIESLQTINLTNIDVKYKSYLVTFMQSLAKTNEIPPEIIGFIDGTAGSQHTSFEAIGFGGFEPSMWNQLSGEKESPIKRNNKGKFYQGGGYNSPKTYYLDNPDNVKIIEKYVDKCYDYERLYIRKHLEYMQLFYFLRELVNLNVDLNLAIQAVTKLKGMKNGQDIKLSKGDGIYIPQKLISKISDVMKVQDNVLGSFTKEYLKDKELGIFHRIKELVKRYKQGTNQGGGGGSGDSGDSITQTLHNLEKAIGGTKTKAEVKKLIDGMSKENTNLRAYKNTLKELMQGVNKRTISKATTDLTNREEIYKALQGIKTNLYYPESLETVAAEIAAAKPAAPGAASAGAAGAGAGAAGAAGAERAKQQCNDKLGGGQFGIVKLECDDCDGKEGCIAKKVIKGDVTSAQRIELTEMLKHEAKILKLLTIDQYGNKIGNLHYICQFIESNTEESSLPMNNDKKPFLSMDYYGKGSLEKYLVNTNNGITFEQIKDILIGICEGMNYINSKNIVHSDLAARNILLANNLSPRIADFGLSVTLDQDTHNKLFQGEKKLPVHILPYELIVNHIYNNKTDVYSFGILFISIIYNKIKNTTGTYSDLEKKINSETLKGLFIKFGASPLISLYKEQSDENPFVRCLKMDHTKRPDFKTLLDELNKINTIKEEKKLEKHFNELFNFSEENFEKIAKEVNAELKKVEAAKAAAKAAAEKAAETPVAPNTASALAGGGSRKLSKRNKKNLNKKGKLSKRNRKHKQKGGGKERTSAAEPEKSLDEVVENELTQNLESVYNIVQKKPPESTLQIEKQKFVLGSVLEKFENAMNELHLTLDQKKKKRKDAIGQLIGEIAPITANEFDGITDSPFDDKANKFILRKGSKVEKYYKVLENLLKGLKKVNLTTDLGSATTLETSIVPEGQTDFNRIKSISSILEHPNIKPKVQKGGKTGGKTWTSTNVSNKRKPLFEKDTRIEVEGKENIQKLLNKCQDLEALYAIKHYEFMEILKPITYFLDTLSKNMVLYIIILNLYGNAETIGEITFEGSDDAIKRAEDVITNITTFIKQQKGIINSITGFKQEGANISAKEDASSRKYHSEAQIAAPPTEPAEPANAAPPAAVAAAPATPAAVAAGAGAEKKKEKKVSWANKAGEELSKIHPIPNIDQLQGMENSEAARVVRNPTYNLPAGAAPAEAEASAPAPAAPATPAANAGVPVEDLTYMSARNFNMKASNKNVSLQKEKEEKLQKEKEEKIKKIEEFLNKYPEREITSFINKKFKGSLRERLQLTKYGDLDTLFTKLNKYYEEKEKYKDGSIDRKQFKKMIKSKLNTIYKKTLLSKAQRGGSRKKSKRKRNKKNNKKGKNTKKKALKDRKRVRKTNKK